jgi:MFS family permease
MASQADSSPRRQQSNLRQQGEAAAGTDEEEERSLLQESRDDQYDRGSPKARSRVVATSTSCTYMTSKTWLFLAITTMLNVHNTIDGEAFMPYLYTRVHCCQDSAVGTLGRQLDSAYDVQALVAGNLSTGAGEKIYYPACSVPDLDPDDPAWSHSPRCNNPAWVRNAAQRVYGVYAPITTVAKVLIIPSAGFLADIYGRKLVLVVSATGPILAGILWAVDALLEPATNALVYSAGGVLSLSAMGGPAQTAMLADLVTPEERGFCFPVLYAAQKGAPLLAQVIGWFALGLHLENYAIFWILMAATQCLILALMLYFLPETLPELRATSISPATTANPQQRSSPPHHHRRPWRLADLNPLRHYLAAMTLMRTDWLLMAMCMWVTLTWVALGGFGAVAFSFLVGDLGFLQEDTLLPSIVGTLSGVASASIAVKVLTKTGQWPGNVIGCYIVAIAYLVYGPASVLFLGRAGPFLGLAMIEFGFGFTAPSYNTIVSWRVRQEDQGKAAAMMAVMSNIGGIFGTYFYSFFLHDATVTGVAAASSFVVSAIFMGVVGLGATGTAWYEGCADKPDQAIRTQTRCRQQKRQQRA